MNARQARARRRAEHDAAEVDRLREWIAQAHDRLHRDDVDGCHELLHGAMGSGVYGGPVAPLSDVAEFDAAFRSLCVAHGVQASFVVLDPTRPGRLLSGGDAELDGYVTKAVRTQNELDRH